MNEDLARHASVARGPTPHGHPTLHDVARHVGVSAQSVSNALNNPERLSSATRERILQAVAEIGYRPNRSARTLRNRRSRLIGVKVDRSPHNRAAPLLDQFLHALAETAGESGNHLILCHAADPVSEIRAYRELLDTTSVDAFVLADTHRGDDRVAALRSWGVPFATFGRSWDGDGGLCWVDVDGGEGIRLATEHVAAQGHRRIAHLGWPLGSEVGRDRRRGWSAVLRRLGLAADLHAEVVDSFEAGRQAAHALLDDPSPATALVCASDTLALGALRALRERRREPGRDVAVTGFDDSPTALLTTPGLTSLAQPIRQVAHDLVRAVEQLLAGDTGPPCHTLLPPHLVVRESSLRAS